MFDAHNFPPYYVDCFLSMLIKSLSKVLITNVFSSIKVFSLNVILVQCTGVSSQSKVDLL